VGVGVYGKTRVFQNISYTKKESKVFQLTQCLGAWFFCCIILPTHPEVLTASLRLKNGGWKTILSLLGWLIFRGKLAVKLREGSESLPSIFFSNLESAMGVSFTDLYGRHLALLIFLGTTNK